MELAAFCTGPFIYCLLFILNAISASPDHPSASGWYTKLVDSLEMQQVWVKAYIRRFFFFFFFHIISEYTSIWCHAGCQVSRIRIFTWGWGGGGGWGQ